MTNREKEEIIKNLVASDTIKKVYDSYIIKEKISFEDWVRDTVNNLLIPKQVDANDVLAKIMGAGDYE